MTAMRLFMVQYGDYAAALDARERGEPETYRAQYHSLDVVDGLLDGGEALVVCLDGRPGAERRGPYRIVSGRYEPRRSGLGYLIAARHSAREIFALAREFEPTHAVIRAPGWVLTRVGWPLTAVGVHVLPVLADYFPGGGWRARLRLLAQVRALNDPAIPVCANHNYPACLSMARAGVDPRKIVPWDWPAPSDPADAPARGRGAGPVSLLYAGAVSEDKGVGDLVRAAGLLAGAGMDFRLTVCGSGPALAGLRAAAPAGVEFLGLTPNREVRERMARVDLVVVPSRHGYPEGLPNVIYEAFENRAPVVCSDHPSFVMRLKAGRGCEIFPAGDAEALAQAVRRAADPARYRELSLGTLDAWRAIQCPVTFGGLLGQWARWTREGGDLEVLRHSLANAGGDTA